MIGMPTLLSGIVTSLTVTCRKKDKYGSSKPRQRFVHYSVPFAFAIDSFQVSEPFSQPLPFSS